MLLVLPVPTVVNNNIVPLFTDYYANKISLNSFRRKSLNQFFFKSAGSCKNTDFVFASVLLVNPEVSRFLNFLLYTFSTQLRGHNSVYINFVSTKLQNFFKVPQNSNTFLITANNFISLLLFFDFLLRLRITFVVKNISEVSTKIKNFSKTNSLINNISVHSVLQFFNPNFVLPSRVNVFSFYKFLIYFALQFLTMFLITKLFHNKNV